MGERAFGGVKSGDGEPGNRGRESEKVLLLLLGFEKEKEGAAVQAELLVLRLESDEATVFGRSSGSSH